jgi:hypothetical protein
MRLARILAALVLDDAEIQGGLAIMVSGRPRLSRTHPSERCG